MADAGLEKRVEVNALHHMLARVQDYPLRLHHQTPGWVGDGAVFHLRIRAAPAQSPPLTEPALAAALLAAARRYHDLGRWWCELILLMPDHVHALLAFPRAPGMPTVIRDWKRGTARFQRVSWQENFFDHRIRHAEDGRATWLYIHRNPAVRGLCRENDNWPFWWSALTPRR